MARNRNIMIAVLMLAVILLVTYYFSPQRQFREMSSKLNPYLDSEHLVDYMGLVDTDHTEKINVLIKEARTNSRTNFMIRILPELFGYTDQELLRFFYKYYLTDKKRFQVLLLLFPKQGVLSLEIDQRLRYAIDEDKINTIVDDILVNSFRKGELEYAESMQDEKRNIEDLANLSISTGVFHTLQALNREILSQLPQIEDRLQKEREKRSYRNIKYWIMYLFVFLFLFGGVNFYLKTHCPRCSSKMAITRVKNPDGIEFKLIKCLNCGYLRRKRRK